MANDATVKDVLYALEFLGDALIRTPIRDGKAKWAMRSGMAVKDSVATQVRGKSGVYSTEDMGRDILRWKP